MAGGTRRGEYGRSLNVAVRILEVVLAFQPWLTFCLFSSQETGTLKARIRKVQVPLGEAVRPSRLPASQLPHMWQLSAGQQYRDSNSRIWDIEHHLKVSRLVINGQKSDRGLGLFLPALRCSFCLSQITGVEELLLKLLPSD